MYYYQLAFHLTHFSFKHFLEILYYEIYVVITEKCCFNDPWIFQSEWGSFGCIIRKTINMICLGYIHEHVKVATMEFSKTA